MNKHLKKAENLIHKRNELTDQIQACYRKFLSGFKIKPGNTVTISGPAHTGKKMKVEETSMVCRIHYATRSPIFVVKVCGRVLKKDGSLSKIETCFEVPI